MHHERGGSLQDLSTAHAPKLLETTSPEPLGPHFVFKKGLKREIQMLSMKRGTRIEGSNPSRPAKSPCTIRLLGTRELRPCDAIGQIPAPDLTPTMTHLCARRTWVDARGRDTAFRPKVRHWPNSQTDVRVASRAVVIAGEVRARGWQGDRERRLDFATLTLGRVAFEFCVRNRSKMASKRDVTAHRRLGGWAGGQHPQLTHEPLPSRLAGPRPVALAGGRRRAIMPPGRGARTDRRARKPGRRPDPRPLRCGRPPCRDWRIRQSRYTDFSAGCAAFSTPFQRTDR
jgi:hypothetical protein